ncbi:MAG: molybdate ABC transporter substrate-binding protein [Segniliparus sp.]|uniref:molybdate ABC transporter substrate-binding protein n=1 Tax=Segniliparus sp. TaxID=2804064 RepID=UPI003F351FC5
MPNAWRAAASSVVAVAALASCSPAQAPAGTSITVFAAASLQRVFTELGAQFEAQHPGTRVTFTFAGSPTLVAQLDQGAKGDVLASADEANMAHAQQKGLVRDVRLFASNHLVIATAPGNPKHIARLADLADPALSVVVCAPQVPCGALAGRVEAQAGVAVPAKSQEPSVTAVLTKVTSGEADAGLVYSTDASAAGERATTVPIPEGDSLATKYPIAVLSQAQEQSRAEAARQFVGLVLGPQGQEALAKAGFGAP